MLNLNRRFKILKTLATATGVAPTSSEIIPAASGRVIGLTQLIAVNEVGGTRTLTLLDGNTAITPALPIGGSGTFIWDKPGGEQLELSLGSGLFGSLGSVGSMRIAAYYVLHDDRTPITKDAARFATFIGSQVTRKPNEFGGQP